MKPVDLAGRQYSNICTAYFPRWVPWEFRYNPEWGNTGYCNRKEKCIFFGDINPVLIIHEICHAVTKGGHGKEWQKRMRSISTQGTALHDEILEDLQGYIDPKGGTSTLNMIQEITDAVLELPNIHDITNSHIVNTILLENGIRPEWEIPLYVKWLRRGVVHAEKAREERRKYDEKRKS